MNNIQLGLLLGTLLLVGLLARVAWFRPLPDQGQLDIEGITSHARFLTTQSQVIAPLLCAKLASDLGYRVDQHQVNRALQDILATYNEDQRAAPYLFVYVKGFALGLAHSITDKPGAYFRLGCEGRRALETTPPNINI